MTTPVICHHIRRGFGVLKLILFLLVGLLIVGGILLKLRQDSLIEIKQVQKDRMAEVERAHRLKIQEEIELGRSTIEAREFEAARKHIKTASILDSQAEFSAEIQALKFICDRAQLIHQREQELVALKRKLDDYLSKQDTRQARAALAQMGEWFHSEHPMRVTFEQRIVTIENRLKEKQQIIEAFEGELAQWHLAKAKQSLAKLKELTDPSSYETFHAKLQQKWADDTLARQDVRKFKAMDSGIYSKALFDAIQVSLTKFPKHPDLIAQRELVASRPQILRVPADFPSLDEAILQAKAGAIIELGIGRHYVEIQLNKPITVRGKGRLESIIESRCSGGSAITISHPNGETTIENLAIQGFQGDGGQHGLVTLLDGKLHIKNCTISRGGGHGIAVVKGSLKLENSLSQYHLWDGVAVAGEQAHAEITSSEFRENGGHGVSLWNHAHLVGKNITSQLNGQSGAAITASATLTAKGVISKKNREGGIYVADHAKVLLAHSQAVDNGLSGLILQKNAQAQLDHVILQRNGEYGYINDRSSKISGLKQIDTKGNKSGHFLQKRLD
ncbi:right-handed parallel beta-helix repeat-containing protein [Rubritalea tangerina]|uniref:Right-handed parallel beta-helix repeat-containing protein n=1 Tax=Rubritalea tangerina TaxID=430798 RepID=A0ABW4Z978_9BACT